MADYGFVERFAETVIDMMQTLTGVKNYTAGYAGVSIDAFIDRVRLVGAHRVIDVRRNAVSRRYGFHKSTLCRICRDAGLYYEHIPALGIPSDWRLKLSVQLDYDNLFDRYEREILSREGGLLKGLACDVAAYPSVLICVEADPRQCHRTRLAMALMKHNGMAVEDIGAAAI